LKNPDKKSIRIGPVLFGVLVIVSIFLWVSKVSDTDNTDEGISGIPSGEAYENWPAFRGLNASGLSQSTTPIHWDIEKSTNIKWKTPIPGLGHSSPAIWENKLFITTAVPLEGTADVKTGVFGDIEPVENESTHEWFLYCIDKNTGEMIWKTMCHKGVPEVKRHIKSSHANSTPVTDGKHVVAFLGSEGLYCYDMDGKLLWQEDFGVLNATFYRAPEAQWEFGSSPIIHDGVLILQVDVLENSFIGAYDVSSGKELWRTPRSDVPTWCTPSIYTFNDSTRIAINGYKHIAGYDFSDGSLIWTMGEGGDIPVPVPVIGKDLLFFTSGHGRLRPIYAVKKAARGDISLQESEKSNEYVAWSARRDGAYMPSPIVIDDCLYRLGDMGDFTCYNASDGEVFYDQKLDTKGWYFASVVASKNAIYCTIETGEVSIIKPGKQFEILAQNAMNDNCYATPAISNDVLYYRTQHHLMAIAD